MSSKRDRTWERLKLETLKQHAHKFDLDHQVDYARPGNSPPERAFQLLQCGADLLFAMMDSGFPSHRRTARKSAIRWTRENLVYRAGLGAGFMACATSTLMSLTGDRLSDDGDPGETVVDPEIHAQLRRSVEDFYPSVDLRSTTSGLERCSAEFDVMNEGKPREAVASGDEPANEYSAALLRGEKPDQDPELVETQRRYARDYFIYHASLTAMRKMLQAGDVRRLSRKTIPVLDPNKRRVSKYRARALAAWIEGSRAYREYALMEFHHASATPAPVEAPPR